MIKMNMTKELIVEKCIGCEHVIVGPEQGPSVCSVYLIPASKWKMYLRCPMCTHLKGVTQGQKFNDPLKASKKKFRGK